MTLPRSYVAIGDSFSEGMGDERPDGVPRGWADLVAVGLSIASSEPISYANLAIRGRLLEPIVTHQLDAAIAMAPELITINGGGNDVLRPKVSTEGIAASIAAAVERAASTGARVLFVSGANPSRHLPMGARIQARGDALAAAVDGILSPDGVEFVDNWGDPELTAAEFWSRDKLHLNARGHTLVAARVLRHLGVDAQIPEARAETHSQHPLAYYREYVLPWIGRRLTGRSSGDNRAPKFSTLQPVPARWDY